MLTVENTTWDLRAARPDLAILPLACLEPHGAHLPIATDAIIVGEIGRRVAESLPPAVWLLPVWPLGTSGQLYGTAGTLSLEFETLWAVVRDVAVSLHAHGIHRVVVLNDHGSPRTTTSRPDGNFIVKTAVRQLNYEEPGLTAIWLQPFAAARPEFTEIFESATDDVHAGEIETSLLLHLAPEQVRDGARDAVPQHPPTFLDFAPLGRLSPSGVWGRPSLATADKGRRALDAAVSATVSYIRTTFTALEAARS